MAVRRLNWQLHFGEPPKWSAGVKFILVDVEPSQRDADKAAVVLQGDAAAVAQQLCGALHQLDPSRIAQWRQQLTQKVHPCHMTHFPCPSVVLRRLWSFIVCTTISRERKALCRQLVDASPCTNGSSGRMAKERPTTEEHEVK